MDTLPEGEGVMGKRVKRREAKKRIRGLART